MRVDAVAAVEIVGSGIDRCFTLALADMLDSVQHIGIGI